MRGFHLWVVFATLVVLTGLVPGAGAWADDSDTPAHPAFDEQIPSIKPAHSAVPKAESPKVSATGALNYQIAIEAPPGRNGASPSLSLRYSSGNANEASAFGAGWSWPIARISRSVRHGTPRIFQSGGTYAYDDAEGTYPTFEGDGVELARDSAAGGSAIVYRDRIDQTGTKSVYHPGANSYWVTNDRKGRLSYYGDLPDHSVPRAVIEDELGVREWLLVRSVDPFGNLIDYFYEQGPPRSDLSQLQLEPLPQRISYGGNLKTGIPQTTEVRFKYGQQPARFLVDHAHGHIFLDRLISIIEVSLIYPQGVSIRHYDFSVDPSPSTGRPLLTGVQEKAGALSGPRQTFEYSRNDGAASSLCPSCVSKALGFAPSAALSAKLDRTVFRLFGSASSGPLSKAPWANLFEPPNTDSDGHIKWPSEFLTALSPKGHYASPAGIPTAFQFIDLDGDGTTDVLYHPNLLGGFGLVQPWVSFLQSPSGSYDTSLYQAYAGKADPLSFASGATEYADIDQDGAVDRIELMPNLNMDDVGGQLSNPAYAGICNFWFHHAGGYTDPVPDEMPIIVAGLILDHAANEVGIRGSEWSSRLSQSLQVILGRSGGSPIDGGIPNGLTLCQHWSAQNPLSDPWLSGYLSGKVGGQAVGSLTVERGRLNAPDESPKLVTSDLKHYPLIGSPEFHFKSNHPTSGGQIVTTGAEDIRNVNTTILDLDGDGIPELMVLKSMAGMASNDANEKWGAGVWRLHDLVATHELDEKDTATRFTASLDSIVLTQKQITGFSIGDAIASEQCEAVSTSRVAEFKPFRLRDALRTKALIGLKRLELPQKQSILVQKYVDGFLSTNLSLGKWASQTFTFTVPSQRFLMGADWISTLLDVNGDGLPDLVLSKGATCLHQGAPLVGGLTQMDHQAGFDVFLNRGDRFETSPAASYSGGPLQMVRNWSKAGGNIGVLVDKDRFPFDTLSFHDIDGDGIVDATLSALIISTASSSSWAFDPEACVRGAPISLDPAAINVPVGNVKILVNCAWRGTGTGWVGDLQIARSLPSDGGINGAVLNWQTGGGACGPFMVPCDSFADNASRTDLRRFADFDNDGMADLINVRDVHVSPTGALLTPEKDETRIYRNTGAKPDLLQAIDNGIGARINVSYRPTARAEITRAPMVPWVVAQVVRDPQVDKSDQAVADTIVYGYGGGLYDYGEREFLGFKTVRESHPMPEADHPGSSATPALVVDRQYFQGEDGSLETCGIANARMGLQISETRFSDPAGLIESRSSQSNYDVHGTCDHNRVAVRTAMSTTTTCKGPACLSSNTPYIRSTRQFSDFDDFDNPQTETETAMRSGFGDGLNGQTITKTALTYLNRLDEWILGLPLTFKRTEQRATGDVVLADESYEYLYDKLTARTVKRLNVGASCPAGASSFVERALYNNDGTIAEANSNDDQFTGGAAPRRTFTYDAQTNSYLASQSDHYLLDDKPAALTTTYSYDPRFGAVQSITDPNGNTVQELRDELGRTNFEVGPDGQKTHVYSYNWSVRPISVTSTDVPGNGQPSIATTEFYDGFGRLRQSEVMGPGSVTVNKWQIFDSTGEATNEALPFAASTDAFVPRSAFSGAAIDSIHDVLGRTVVSKGADGRTTHTIFSPEVVTAIDAKGTPKSTFKDAMGRTIAIDESFRPAGSIAPFQPFRTRFNLDSDGHVLSTIDADGNSRAFLYDERGDLVSADALHRPGQATGVYSFCFDGLGRQIREDTPGHVVTTAQLDALGRVVARHYLPVERFGTADETYKYDNPKNANALGRLTQSENALVAMGFGYDRQGNISQRIVTTKLGAPAAPFKDGTYTYSAEFDALNRIVAETLPQDPTQLASPILIQYVYDSRGNPSRLSLGSSVLASIGAYTPTNNPQNVDLMNGLSENWSYDLLNNRLTESAVRRGAGPPLLSYSLSYDANDNPTVVSRFVGAGVGSTDTLKKVFSFDSVNRLQSATFSGLTSAPQSFDYAFSPGGNIQTKDGFSYAYEKSDPQEVTARSKASTPSEHYSYNDNGQMTGAAPGHDGLNWTYQWDGAGRLASAISGSGAAASQSVFRYGPDGARIAVTHRTGNLESSDVHIGSLELRAEDGADARRAYYNLSFGPAHIQLALKPGAGGLLSLDLDATRFYHQDYLGSTALVSSADGSTSAIGRLDYAPYGERLFADEGTARIHTRYTGKELDPTGLTYFGARYADTVLGRWISPDQVIITNPREIEQRPGTGLFTFVGSNPVARTDPDGRQECEECLIKRNARMMGLPYLTPSPESQAQALKLDAWILFGILNPGAATVSAVALSNLSGASDLERVAVLGGVLLGKVAGVAARLFSREAQAGAGVIGEAAAENPIPTIGGRLPINGKYAGGVHPSGVKFTNQGFPNFGPHSVAEVEIEGLTGNYARDAAMANRAAGLESTPEGYVWHHVEDGRTMQLLPDDIHAAVRHTGGAAVIRNGGFDPP
jgi:RHS repeat-associated protein